MQPRGSVHARSLRHWRGAGPAPELRVLRPRSTARVDGGDDLHLRVHLVRAVRQDVPRRHLSELRRWPPTSARSTCWPARRPPGLDPARGADGPAPGL